MTEHKREKHGDFNKHKRLTKMSQFKFLKIFLSQWETFSSSASRSAVPSSSSRRTDQRGAAGRNKWGSWCSWPLCRPRRIRRGSARSSCGRCTRWGRTVCSGEMRRRSTSWWICWPGRRWRTVSRPASASAAGGGWRCWPPRWGLRRHRLRTAQCTGWPGNSRSPSEGHTPVALLLQPTASNLPDYLVLLVCFFVLFFTNTCYTMEHIFHCVTSCLSCFLWILELQRRWLFLSNTHLYHRAVLPQIRLRVTESLLRTV